MELHVQSIFDLPSIPVVNNVLFFIASLFEYYKESHSHEIYYSINSPSGNKITILKQIAPKILVLPI